MTKKRTNDVMHTSINCKAVEITETENSMVARIIDADDELKNIREQVLKFNPNN